MQPELGAEIRDRPVDELGIRGGEPGAGGRRVARGRSGDGVVQAQELGVRCAGGEPRGVDASQRSEEHTSELQSRLHLVCRLLLEKKKKTIRSNTSLSNR